MTATRFARRSPARSPWMEVEDMTNRLNRIFSEPQRRGASSGSAWSPTVNVEENSDALLLTAEVPGLSLDDLEIEVENNVLSLRGEKKAEDLEGEDRRLHLGERKFGSFNRTFTLPRTVKTEEISARVKNGVLLIQIPKAPEAKSRKIEVKAEA